MGILRAVLVGLVCIAGSLYCIAGGVRSIQQFECDDSHSLERDITSYDGTFDRGSTLVVTMASSAQLELLRIWLSARERHQVIVVALDMETIQECCTIGIPYLFDSNFQLGGGEDIHFMTKEFLKIGLVKFRALRCIVQAGYNVLFSEIDVYEFSDPEQCGSANTTSSSWEQDKRGCIGKHGFDLEIHPEIVPGKVAKPNTELNIGFFYMRSSPASFSVIDEVVGCLEERCGWDQAIFSSLTWKMQCDFVDDNTNTPPEKTGPSKEECLGLRVRVLNAYYFPIGTVVPPDGLVPPDYYDWTETCPVLVHCTGRTGLLAKLDCLRRVQTLYRNCKQKHGKRIATTINQQSIK